MIIIQGFTREYLKGKDREQKYSYRNLDLPILDQPIRAGNPGKNKTLIIDSNGNKKHYCTFTPNKSIAGGPGGSFF